MLNSSAFSFSHQPNFLWISVLAFQIPFLLILLRRLSTAQNRTPPLNPLYKKVPQTDSKVTIVIPTLNERLRLPQCLEGLRSQTGVTEIIVVDSHSQDGTPEYVRELQKDFPIRLSIVADGPLPLGWVGKSWALQTGFLNSSPKSRWILGLDADTVPQLGLVECLVQKADLENYDMVSLSPRFILKTSGEQFLQPALLVTLIYRFGASGDTHRFNKNRIMANGQCFLSRRSFLEKIQGFEAAKFSFSEDVTLVRTAAKRGAKVGFLDGANLIQVRMYTSMAETWKEWGRSLDLKDSATPLQTLGDCAMLLSVQGLPLILFLCLFFLPIELTLWTLSLLALNALLILIRFLLLFGIRNSYTKIGFMFWLSPLADPAAVMRILLSASRRPTEWRGRIYGKT